MTINRCFTAKNICILKCFTQYFTISWVQLFHVKHYLVSIIQNQENVSRETFLIDYYYSQQPLSKLAGIQLAELGYMTLAAVANMSKPNSIGFKQPLSSLPAGIKGYHLQLTLFIVTALAHSKAPAARRKCFKIDIKQVTWFIAHGNRQNINKTYF